MPGALTASVASLVPASAASVASLVTVSAASVASLVTVSAASVASLVTVSAASVASLVTASAASATVGAAVGALADDTLTTACSIGASWGMLTTASPPTSALRKSGEAWCASACASSDSTSRRVAAVGSVRMRCCSAEAAETAGVAPADGGDCEG
jgi:hypothetical protein